MSCVERLIEVLEPNCLLLMKNFEIDLIEFKYLSMSIFLMFQNLSYL